MIIRLDASLCEQIHCAHRGAPECKRRNYVMMAEMIGVNNSDHKVVETCDERPAFRAGRPQLLKKSALKW